MPTCLKFDPKQLLPPFDDSLPTALRRIGERTLLNSQSLTRRTYSTRRFLCDDSSLSDVLVGSIFVAEEHSLQCEAVSSDLVRYCGQNQLDLAKNSDIEASIAVLQPALLEVIRPHHFLWLAISELAWRCHIVHARHDDYDVSFSDPAIPFSIFVSVPAKTDRTSILRVAENLVHETMHLQLTLFERCCPLVDTAINWSMYSPWKRENRPTQGLLHGLYVFRVIGWMWRHVAESATNETDRRFALRRIKDIEEEVDTLRLLGESPALTRTGTLFLNQLLNS